MTIEELKINVNKTRKIIDYGINSDLGRDYVVRVYQLDWDWDKTPKILSVMFIKIINCVRIIKKYQKYIKNIIKLIFFP